MRPRDLIVVCAVVLIGGFAAADAIRGRANGNEKTRAESVAIQTSPSRLAGPQPQAEAPANWPLGTLGGSLVFTDASNCRLRVIGLAGGRERPLASFRGNCQLWTPPVGDRIAYGLGATSADGFAPFRLADLARPNADLGGYRALFGVVLWSPDGQRVAWCGRRRTGFDLEVGGASRRLPTCPIAYTPDGEIAYAIGKDLVVKGKVVHRANGGITYVQYGRDGSLALLIDGVALERWEGNTLTGGFALPRALQGRTPVLRFDNCAAVFPPLGGDIGRIELVSLGCLPSEQRQSFVGRDAAWAPDGQWLAVAERENIAFHRIVGPAETVRWPTQAAQLAWRPR